MQTDEAQHRKRRPPSRTAWRSSVRGQAVRAPAKLPLSRRGGSKARAHQRQEISAAAQTGAPSAKLVIIAAPRSAAASQVRDASPQILVENEAESRGAPPLRAKGCGSSLSTVVRQRPC